MKAIKFIKILATLFIFLLTFPFFQVNSTNVLITIEENYTRVYMVLNLNQNLTDFPKLNEKIIDSQLIQAKESIQNSLKKLSPNALVENLVITIFSSDKLLNVTITFNLKNVSFKQGNVLEVDISWKSFKVEEDLEFKGIHYNLIGEYHLKPVLENWKNNTSFSFYINKSGPVDPSFALEKVEKLSFLDFTVLDSNLSSWNSTYNIQKHKTSWHFTSKPLIDLTVYESGLNFTRAYYVLMRISAIVECFGLGKAIGNKIKTNIGKGNYEMLMIFIILVFIGSFILIKKRLKSLSKTKKFKS